MKRLALCLWCVCAVYLPAAAHVLDQYLQIAQIDLAPGAVRVEMRLIPGVQVADRIFALIDADGDGNISAAEEQAYARRVLQDLALEVDGRRAPLTLTEVRFPSRLEMNEGFGAIRLHLAAETASGMEGEHQLSFRNDHLPELGAYLANALVPTTHAIKITGQTRDALQHGLRIDFRATPETAHGWPRRVGISLLCLCVALLCAAWKIRRSMLPRINRTLRSDIPPLARSGSRKRTARINGGSSMAAGRTRCHVLCRRRNVPPPAGPDPKKVRKALNPTWPGVRLKRCKILFDRRRWTGHLQSPDGNAGSAPFPVHRRSRRVPSSSVPIPDKEIEWNESKHPIIRRNC
jgi:hypothetical protein